MITFLPRNSLRQRKVRGNLEKEQDSPKHSRVSTSPEDELAAALAEVKLWWPNIPSDVPLYEQIRMLKERHLAVEGDKVLSMYRVSPRDNIDR